MTMIRCVVGPGFRLDAPQVGQYLAAYDPERSCAHPSHDPAGQRETEWTPDPAKAIQYPDARAAFAAWTAVPACHPVRADGKPNKPLTAYSIEVV